MRRTTTFRKMAAAAAVPTLLLGLAACGSDSADGSDGSAASAEDAAEDLPEEGEEVDIEDFVADMKGGIEKATTAQTSMTMDYGSGGMEAEGEVDYTSDPIAMDLTMSGEAMSGQELELRMVDGIMYMNMGSMSNDKFLKYDLSDPSSLPPGMEDLQGQMDPLAAFDEFEPALKSVVFAGTEDVDGEELNHFTLVMDTAEVESLKDIPAEAGLPDEVEYDLWFDGEYLMRKMDMTMEMATTVTLEATMDEWGEPVDIEAPDEKDVVDGSMAG